MTNFLVRVPDVDCILTTYTQLSNLATFILRKLLVHFTFVNNFPLIVNSETVASPGIFEIVSIDFTGLG